MGSTKHLQQQTDTYELRQMRTFPMPIGVYERLSETNRAECLLMMAVARSTLGWQASESGRRKASATLNHTRLRAMTGCRSSTTISAAIDRLVRLGLLETLAEDGALLTTPEDRRRYHRALRFRIPRRLVETKAV